MKRQTEKPSEPVMRFAWEAPIQAYQRHLDAIHDKMPPEVQKLCLHDAGILEWDNGPFWSPVAVLSLRRDNEVFSIIYFLLDKVREHPPKGSRPFSKMRRHWLYDELDLANNGPGMFVHRVLLSDGTVLEIPFGSVRVQSINVVASYSGEPARLAE